MNRSAAFKLSFVLALAVCSAAPARAWAVPYSGSEIAAVQTDDEAKIREIRTQEVTQLRIALGRRIPANRRADLFFRLAEIYVEAYRMEFLLEGRAHEKRLERGAKDKFIDRSRSKPYLSLGIKACQEILRARVPYAKMDEVYYFLGFNHGELGREKESRQYFTLLTQRYPNSPYAVEAYRELGDAAFSANQYRKAQGYYESAVRRNLGDSLPRILHKLAWTYYRLKMYDRAVSTMREAVSRASAGDEKFLSLREEALRDMAIFMTETGKVDEALAYFGSVAGGKDFYPKLLERLGKQYERNVEPAKAVQVYETLLRTHPDDEAAFRVRAKLVDLDLRRKRFKEALSRIQGTKFFSGGEADTRTAALNLRAMVRRTATENHEAFRKSGNRAALAVSEEFYQAYLTTVLSQDDPRNETPEIQMYLADVKRELGKSKEASGLYRKVLDSGDKRYAKEAGTLWTASLSDAIKKASANGGARASNAPSALEREFVEAADEMASALGDAPEGREASLRAAQVMAGYRTTHEEAVDRVEKIVDRWPSTTQALTAARLWIQLLADRLPQGSPAKIAESDEGEELLSAIKTLKDNSALLSADSKLGQGKLKIMLGDQETRLKVGVIAVQERDQDFGAAGRGYEEFAAAADTRELAENAFANAVGAYGKAGDAEAVDRVVAAWLKRYPDGKRPIEVVRSAATSALIQGRFSGAAALFERLGRRGGDPESLETAARLYEGDGELSRSRAARDLYLDLYKNSPRRFGVALDVARDLDRQGQDSQAASFYKYCQAGPAQFEAECGARLADLFLKADDLDNARAAYRRVAGIKGGRSPFISYARFRLAELIEKQGRFETLSLPDTQLRKGLQQRLEFLEPLSRAYNASVEAGGPCAVASLDRLASWAMRFADEVDQIQPPSSASAESVALFRKNLREVSDPLRKKAYETWADAYRKAVSSETLSPALPGIGARLAESRRPGSPAHAQGPRGRFRLAGLPADGGSDGSDGAFEKVRARLTKSAQDAQAWVDYGNLLWGKGKPGLSRIAYDRALELNRRNPAALNNRGVIVASSGEEDWLQAAEAAELFEESLKQDAFFVAAKMNRATLLNYYRLFSKAKPLWEQVSLKAPTADSHDGLGVALQGLGNARAAAAAFAKADDAGADSDRFARVYHDAARAESGEKCASRLDDLSDSKLGGFEREAVSDLRNACKQWKKGT